MVSIQVEISTLTSLDIEKFNFFKASVFSNVFQRYFEKLIF